jgi:hypothetical protein
MRIAVIATMMALVMVSDCETFIDLLWPSS